MSLRLGLPVVASWLLCWASPAFSEEPLTPAQLARLRLDEDRIRSEVNRAHGNRPSSEMSTQERRSAIRQEEAALRALFAQKGVDEKAYARHWAKMTLEERREVRALMREEIAKDERARLQREARQHQAPPIQQGISDEQPVILESTPEAPPLVETGLPVDN